MPNWWIGVDAGATKTRLVIKIDTGTTVTRSGPAANVHNQGVALAWKTIHQLIVSTLQQTTQPPLNPQAECAVIGLSGLDTEADRLELKRYLNVHNQLPAHKTIITNDAYIGLRSFKRVHYGICLIAGTGANCYGLSPDGNEAYAGDWGFILGDQGSGFTIGQKLLQRVMQEYDGREPVSPLTRAVLNHFHLSHPGQLPGMIYQDPNFIGQAASVSTLLRQKDIFTLPFVQDLVTTSQQAMLQSVQAVLTRLVFTRNRQLPIVLVGSLFKNQPMTDFLRQKLPHLHPKITVIRPQNHPVIGALNVAQNHSAAGLLPLSTLIINRQSAN
jgi:N-acetylglucosamine kinase-like BadF-type ATPase